MIALTGHDSGNGAEIFDLLCTGRLASSRVEEANRGTAGMIPGLVLFSGSPDREFHPQASIYSLCLVVVESDGAFEVALKNLGKDWATDSWQLDRQIARQVDLLLEGTLAGSQSTKDVLLFGDDAGADVVHTDHTNQLLVWDMRRRWAADSP